MPSWIDSSMESEAYRFTYVSSFFNLNTSNWLLVFHNWINLNFINYSSCERFVLQNYFPSSFLWVRKNSWSTCSGKPKDWFEMGIRKQNLQKWSRIHLLSPLDYLQCNLFSFNYKLEQQSLIPHNLTPSSP